MDGTREVRECKSFLLFFTSVRVPGLGGAWEGCETMLQSWVLRDGFTLLASCAVKVSEARFQLRHFTPVRCSGFEGTDILGSGLGHPLSRRRDAADMRFFGHPGFLENWLCRGREEGSE